MNGANAPPLIALPAFADTAFVFCVYAFLAIHAPAKRIRNMSITEAINEL